MASLPADLRAAMMQRHPSVSESTSAWEEKLRVLPMHLHAAACHADMDACAACGGSSLTLQLQELADHSVLTRLTALLPKLARYGLQCLALHLHGAILCDAHALRAVQLLLGQAQRLPVPLQCHSLLVSAKGCTAHRMPVDAAYAWQQLLRATRGSIRHIDVCGDVLDDALLGIMQPAISTRSNDSSEAAEQKASVCRNLTHLRMAASRSCKFTLQGVLEHVVKHCAQLRHLVLPKDVPCMHGGECQPQLASCHLNIGQLTRLTALQACTLCQHFQSELQALYCQLPGLYMLRELHLEVEHMGPGHLPHALQQLSKLTHLAIRLGSENAQMCHAISNAFRCMPELHTLQLSFLFGISPGLWAETGHADAFAQNMCAATQLQRLVLCRCNCGALVLGNSIARLQALTSLELQGVKAHTAKMVGQLHACTQLQELSCCSVCELRTDGRKLARCMKRSLPFLTSLTRLALQSCRLKDDVCKFAPALKTLESLVHLDLSGNLLSNEGVERVVLYCARLPKLQSVELGHEGAAGLGAGCAEAVLQRVPHARWLPWIEKWWQDGSVSVTT